MFKHLLKRTEFKSTTAYRQARASVFDQEYCYAIVQPALDCFFLLKTPKKEVSRTLDIGEHPSHGTGWSEPEFNYIQERLYTYFGPIEQRHGKDPTIQGFNAPTGYSVALFRLMLLLILQGEDRP